mgnify:FL=1|jgi:hypothetical protein
MDIEQQANYYAVIPAPVRYNKKLKYPERLLYGEITALSNRYGYCFASNKYFASLYDVVPETVSRWISHLKECGYIDVNIIKNENNQIIERRIYIIDKINNTYCLNYQYPSCVKNQEGIDKKVKHNNINNKIDRLFYYVIKNEIENYKEFNINERKEFIKNIETLELNYNEEITKNMAEENKSKIKIILFFVADMVKHKKIIPINTYTRTIMILVYDKCKMKEREYKNTSNEIINFYEYYSKSLLKELFKI